MTYARRLLESGVRMVDVAADFRLRDQTAWEKWYGMEHQCPELLEEAVYGLPELNREHIRSARLVANPGCYPHRNLPRPVTHSGEQTGSIK